MNERIMYDVIVCGAGPSGLMAAINCASAGKKTALFDHMPSAGKKLLATGGGHCNITKREPLNRFLRAFGDKEKFVRSALKQFSQEALIDFFESAGLLIHTTDTLQVYPKSNKASDVLECLLKLASESGVELYTGCKIDSINIENGSLQGVICSNGKQYDARSVIIATGGKSFSKLGADGSGYGFAKAAGHEIITPVAALAGLVCKEEWPAQCSGITIDPVAVYIDIQNLRSVKRRGSLLFTHRGVSGPAILDLSGSVSRLLTDETSVKIRIKPLPNMTRENLDEIFITAQQKNGGRKISLILAELLPSRLASHLLRISDVNAETRAADVNKQAKLRLLDILDNGIPLTITGSESFDNAMVTSGGVSCDEICPDTMESLRVHGLYFCGEVIDVDGLCGGYNLQWAFSSGHCAGTHAAVASR